MVFWFLGLCAFSQGKEDELNVLFDLISVVTEEDEVSSDSVLEVPDVLWDVVSNFYAEQVVPNNVPSDVLSYLSRVYSEHGYDESGGWAPSPYTFRSNVSNSPRTGFHESSENNRSKFSTFTVPPHYSFPSYGASDFRMPINGSYTSFYGYRPKFGRFHKGVDISLKIGDTVRSVLPGVVVKVKCDPKGYGNYVVVSHAGELETLYAHLSRELVVSGQRLKAGDAVGLGGVTGNSTGPHLHFETRVKGEAIDPLYYLPRKAVRK